MSDGGIVNRAFYDAGREFTFLRVQDVEPILEHNQCCASREHMASFPADRIGAERHDRKWLHEVDRGSVGLRIGSEEFDRLIWRKLQDPNMRNSALTA